MVCGGVLGDFWTIFFLKMTKFCPQSEFSPKLGHLGNFPIPGNGAYLLQLHPLDGLDLVEEVLPLPVDLEEVVPDADLRLGRARVVRVVVQPSPEVVCHVL